MAYHIEKEANGESAIVIDGFEKGVASSPHKGIASIRNANIATETGEVMNSYSRLQQSMTGTTASGTLAQVTTNTVSLSITGSNNRFKGFWITVTNSSNTGQLANTNYYVLPSTTGASVFQLSLYYNGAIITGLGAGLTATITIMSGKTMGIPVAYTTEKYNGTLYRYYVLDSKGLVWVYDTGNEIIYSSSDNVSWFLPDTSVAYFGSDSIPSGIAVLHGWLFVFSGNKIWVKPTVNLGNTVATTTTWAFMTNGYLNSIIGSANPHFAFVGKQDKLYYTDGDYVGSIFPNVSVVPGGPAINVQSYASYAGSSTTGTITQLIAGSIPYTADATGAAERVPVVFFAKAGGSISSNLSPDVVYWIEYDLSAGTFEVYAASTGGSPIDIDSSTYSETQYFNTFYPIGAGPGAYGTTPTFVFTPQRVNLPYSEVGTTIAEIGNTVLIGATGNTVYPWNQIDPTPSSFIFLAENYTKTMITVNQVAYIFAGNKGNVYITDGSVASLVLKVPDYCAGLPGTQNSYFEPRFTWGGAAYIRGRVYFSILDQTSSKDGNCGGVWSFYPTQNMATEQDTGLALRLENQNSYATYNGYATVIIPHNNQNVISPQYWAAWVPTSTSLFGGIDFTNTAPSTAAVIESDLIPVGTVLEKRTFKQIEYKLASPLNASDSVTLAWRSNGTEEYTSLGTAVVESTTSLSGYFTVNIQGLQWVQIQATLTPVASIASSMCRLQQIRIR